MATHMERTFRRIRILIGSDILRRGIPDLFCLKCAEIAFLEVLEAPSVFVAVAAGRLGFEAL